MLVEKIEDSYPQEKCRVSKFHIAILDDLEPIVNLLARLVESMGFAASRFTRPKPFMKMIEDGVLPDLLILDIVMPEMDAIEIIDWMEKNKISIPIILVSGYDEDYIKVTKSLAAHKNAKVIGSFTKPLFLPDIQATLKEIVNSQHP